MAIMFPPNAPAASSEGLGRAAPTTAQRWGGRRRGSPPFWPPRWKNFRLRRTGWDHANHRTAICSRTLFGLRGSRWGWFRPDTTKSPRSKNAIEALYQLS